MRGATATALPLALLVGLVIGVSKRPHNLPSTTDEPHGRNTKSHPQPGWIELERSANPRGDGSLPDPSPRAMLEARLRPAAGSPESMIDSRPSHQLHSHQPMEIPEEFVGLTTDEWIQRLPEPQRGRLVRYREQLSTFDPEFRRYICWAPDTPPELIAAYQQVEQEAGLGSGEVRTLANQFLGSGHWSRTATNGSGNGSQGTPVTVTWSVVPDGTLAPDLDNGPSRSSNLRSWLAGLYGGSSTASAESQPWFPLFEEALGHLAEQTGLTFVYEPNDDGGPLSNSSLRRGSTGVRGDLRISGRMLDGFGSTLGFAYAPDYGDIVIDTGDAYFNTTSNNSIRLVNVLAHEAGHAVGLAHVCPMNRTKLMEPSITTRFRGSKFDEIQSLQRQYGDEFETHNGVRDNDRASTATPLELQPGTTSKQWLGIDGVADQDWISIDIPANQQLTLRIIPAAERYDEGGVSSTGYCLSGSTFEASLQQDLRLQLLDSSGSSILAQASSAGIGEPEEILAFVPENSGLHHIRVSGSGENNNQLYRLEALLEEAPPTINFAVQNLQLEAESNVGSNREVDPGETVRFTADLANIGRLAATNVTITLQGPPELTVFDPPGPIASIDAEASTPLQLTFAVDGECGDELELEFSISSDQGTTNQSFPIRLGSTDSVTQQENFDDSDQLPTGWTSATQDAGADWTVRTGSNDSPPNAAFSPGVVNTGEAYLVSPNLTVGSNGGTLSFRHAYDLESRYDGALLEASLDGGSWFDLLDSDALVVSGNYNSSILSQAISAISSRQAWTGDSNGFITTSLELPTAWKSRSIRFRWRLVHDGSFSDVGWTVDAFLFESEGSSCDPFRPQLSISANLEDLSERSPSSGVELQLSTPLPLGRPLAIPLQAAGSAGIADLLSPPVAILDSGRTEQIIELFAAEDGVAEGEEELILSIDPSATDYAPGTNPEVRITIEDSAYGAWAAASIAKDDPHTLPEVDADQDGWSNLAEYLLGTEPGSSHSSPSIEVLATGSSLELRVGPTPVREDATLGAEASSDLTNWASEGIVRSPLGFTIERNGETGFLRLTFELK